MHQEVSFQPLLIVIVLALIVPLITNQLRSIRIPIVVGELIVGIIIGHSGFNLIPEDPWINFLAIFGFAYLMFLSGMEIDFGVILANERTDEGVKGYFNGPMGIGILFFGLVLASSLLVSFALVYWGLITSPWIMSLILSTTSLGVVVPVLKERHLLGKVYGQTLLVSALIADFMTMLIISIYVILNSHGFTPQLLTVLILGGAFLLIYRLTSISRHWLHLQRIADELSHATAQIQTRSAFAIALAFIVLAEVLNIEIILGAFLGGVIISLVAGEEGSLLREKLDAIGYGFLIPIFFIMVGVNFDLPSLLSSTRSLVLGPLLLVAVYLIRLLGTLVYWPRFGWSDTLAATVLLSARLSLTIAAAEIGLRLGVIDNATNSAIILLTILTCVISPLLFNRLYLAKENESEETRAIIIIGAPPVARLLAQSLHNLNEEIVMASDQPGELAAARQAGLPVIQANIMEEEGLRIAGLEATETVIVITGDDQKSAHIARLIRSHFGTPNVIAHVHDTASAQALGKLGIHVATPLAATVQILTQMVHNPALLAATTHPAEGYSVREIAVFHPRWMGNKLQVLSRTLPTHCRVLMITREGIPLIPTGETTIQKGDVLTLIGPPEEIEDLFREARANLRVPIEG